MSAALFLATGAAAGVIQATMLARTGGVGLAPLLFLVRLGLVAGILVTAAHSGRLWPAASGWMAGFLLTVLWVQWRLR